MFCAYFNLQELPAKVETLCLYVQFLSRSFRSVESIRNYLSGIKTLHLMLDLDFPKDNTLQLNLLLRGISRLKQHVPRQAEPITPLILLEMYKHLDFSLQQDVVFWSVSLLMLFLMARKSNMMPNSVKNFDPTKQLLREDVIIENQMLLVNIKWSKTRQFGHSRQIPITPMTGSCLCPVTADTNMVSLLPAKDSDPAFCLVSNKRKLIPYTYAQFHKQLKYLIRKTGRNEKLYSSHGLRRAGATLALNRP